MIKLPQTERFDGRGLVFWYQATGLARASASCQYRIGNFVEHLRGATSIIHPTPPERWWGHAHTLIVVRPYLDRNAERILEKARKKGIRLVADFDDLLFAGDPAEYPLVQRGTLSVNEAARRLDHVRDDLAAFDAFTAATEPLVDELRSSLGPDANVRWIPNGLSASWVAQGHALHKRWQPGDAKVMRYLAGSPSHDADFAMIAPVLRRFLATNDDVSLETVGPVAIGDGWPGKRVRQHSRVPFAELPRYIASSWVTLAPLEDTSFNRCKSAIKVLESAAFGCPCAATPIPDVDAQASSGAAACGVDDGMWWQTLQSLAASPRPLVTLGDRAFARFGARVWARLASRRRHYHEQGAA